MISKSEEAFNANTERIREVSADFLMQALTDKEVRVTVITMLLRGAKEGFLKRDVKCSKFFVLLMDHAVERGCDIPVEMHKLVAAVREALAESETPK
jgi:hypothetical protein